MKIRAKTKDAYRLLHEGTLTLSEVEANGIRIDTQYCLDQQKKLGRKIDHLEKELLTMPEIKAWKAQYGHSFSLDSNPQLAWLLFTKLKLTSTKTTDSGEDSTDQSVLEQVNLPFAKPLLQYKRYSKTKETFLMGIIRETVNGYLHPFYNLNIARTFRSSSSNINFQNLPNRVDELKKIIRQAFIPRPGHRLGGLDYSGIEVRIAACYHQDPEMIAYIKDPTKDMHRDQAMEIFFIEENEVTKQARYCAKNCFVFPQFYGDWWKSCAENAWEQIDTMGIKTKSGVPLKEHMRTQGIKGLGTLDERNRPSKGSFYSHMQDVENRFWNERFKVYAQWKKDWVKLYEKLGYLDTYTGFRCSGVMGKNDIVNYPIQGSAFHCLLWAITPLHKWVKKQGMATKIVGQIHDEIVPDVHADELNPFLSNAKQIMCFDIRDEWDWIIVPLDIEAAFAPVDTSWYFKEEVKITDAN